MKIAVFSNASFLQPYVRLGLQHLAMKWAAMGHSVDYYSCPVHMLDFLSPSRRRQWAQAWQGSGCHSPAPGLVERIPRSFFSRRRRWWLLPVQLQMYTCLFQRDYRDREYDWAVGDVSFSTLFMPKVKTLHKVLRLNDHPEGFLHFMSPIVLQWFKDLIKEKGINQVWGVSGDLVDWATSISSSLPVHLIQNGVELDQFSPCTDKQPSKTAVYIGTFQPWFDFRLLCETAKLLPDWKFDLYGPIANPTDLGSAPNNLRYSGVIKNENLPELLRNYSVGLIPFTGMHQFLEGFDPLKAYQYWAAGLGIASTSYGRLEKALAPWAEFGNNPATFSAAIRSSEVRRLQWREDPIFRKHLEGRHWKVIAKDALALVQGEIGS
jgi:glycosyltransferase involved in cell wall biosynthesis